MKRSENVLEKMISQSPHILAPADLTFLDLQYLTSDEKELIKLRSWVEKFSIGLKFDRVHDLRGTTKIIQFYNPDTRLNTLDECTYTYDESDEIMSRVNFPIINVSFSGDIESLGHIKEHVTTCGDNKIITPYTNKNAIIILKPIQKKFLYMELHMTKNIFLY